MNKKISAIDGQIYGPLDWVHIVVMCMGGMSAALSNILSSVCVEQMRCFGVSCDLYDK